MAATASTPAPLPVDEDGFVYETLPELEAEVHTHTDADEDDIAALVNSMMKRDPTLLAQAAAAATAASAGAVEPRVSIATAGGESSGTHTRAHTRAYTEERPPVADDFIRNFMVRHGLQRSLDAFSTEWYEFQARGLLPDDDALGVPDVYAQNERLGTLVTRLRTELSHASEVAARAQATWDKLRKERDFHRMHHQRVVQEKNRLITDMKRLKTHYEAYAPTLTELRSKYETAMREKALLKVERDRLAARCSALEAQVKAYEEGGAEAPLGLPALPAIGGAQGGILKPTESFAAKAAGTTGPIAGRRAASTSKLGQSTAAGTRVSPVGTGLRAARSRGAGALAPQEHARLPEDMVNPFIDLAFEPAHAAKYRPQQNFKAHNAAVAALAFHPTKPVVATGSDDLTWRLWSVPDGELLMAGEGHRSWIADIDFHPGGTHIATAAGDGVIKLWDLSSAACSATFTDHTQTAWAVAWHATGDYFASASMDHSCKLFDVHSGKARLAFRGHVDSVNAVEWQPFSNTIATGSGDKTVSLWDARTGLCVQTLYGHTNAVNDVTFSLRGDVLASCDSDGVVRLWDIRMVMERGSLSVGRRAVTSLAFDRSAQVLAATCDDGTLKVLDCSNVTEATAAALASGITPNMPGATAAAPSKIFLLATLPGHTDTAQAVAFDPTSSFLVSAGNDAYVRMWAENEIPAQMQESS